MRTPKQSQYILNVGQQDEKRLAQLDEIYGPYTHAFLQKIGLKPGMQVLDLGCGTGNVSCWIAKQVGPTGKVIAVDGSAEQIEIAKKQAKQYKLTNIIFEIKDVTELSQLNLQVDIAFSRFLLIHLSDPEKTLRMMEDALKPKGILCCDEMALRGSYCYPPSIAFDETVKLNYQLFQKQKFDLDYGAKLFKVFKQLSLKDVNFQIAQPILITSSEKMLWYNFFISIKQKMLQAKLVEERVYDDYMQGLLDIANDDETYILSSHNFQVWGSKS